MNFAFEISYCRNCPQRHPLYTMIDFEINIRLRISKSKFVSRLHNRNVISDSKLPVVEDLSSVQCWHVVVASEIRIRLLILPSLSESDIRNLISKPVFKDRERVQNSSACSRRASLWASRASSSISGRHSCNPTRIASRPMSLRVSSSSGSSSRRSAS